MKESEFKSLKQEHEQSEIKIKTLNRTQEDEKSKANALKASEDKLIGEAEEMQKKLRNLEAQVKSMTEQAAESETTK